MLKRASAHGASVSSARALERCAHVLVHGLRPRLKALNDERAAWFIRWACACALVDGGGKPAARLVKKLPLALGFGERERRVLEVIVRGVVARAPAPNDPRVLALTLRDRPLALAVSAVLHVAVALSSSAPFVLRVPKRGTDGVVLIVTSSPIADPRALAERRAPLESLLSLPVWWKAGAT